MTETTVVTHEDPENDPSILADAAVKSNLVAGASLERATDAKEDAAEAHQAAENAGATAGMALDVAADKVNEQRAREIAREELAALIAAAAEPKEPVPATEPERDEAEVDPQVLPPSVKKANDDGKKKGFFSHLADVYHGDSEE
jgi:hypothetical protein